MTQPNRTSTVGDGTVYFEDVEVGRTYWGSEVVADEEELLAYGRRFDPWPMHTDPDIGDASPLAVSWHQVDTRSASTTCQSTRS